MSKLWKRIVQTCHIWAGFRAPTGVVLALAVAAIGTLGAGRNPDPSAIKSVAPVRDDVRLLGNGEPECMDADGDGYGSPGDASCANGAAEDCDDGDAGVNPGASEACDGTNTKCCNGVDDNCDGQIDENATAFTRDGDPAPICFGGDRDTQSCAVPADCPGGNCLPGSPTYLTFLDLPLGAACVNGLGICARTGVVVCDGDATGAECDAVPGDPETEGPVGDPTCFDRKDNDCDGLVDHGNPDEPKRISPCKGPELCNEFDDDNDGEVDEDFNLGEPCTVGQGLCENTGELVCDAKGGTVCNAVALTPGLESGPGSIRCTDGQDNDCDGLTDLDDPGCQKAELCDGKDNDGDGQIDEDFAAALGQACVSGVGPCQASGVTICSADGTGTVCDAVALTGSPEGPSGLTCMDGIDNDCDGDTDGEDSGCGSADLAATCALPYLRGRTGGDCQGWHRISFGSSGGQGDVQVTAELQAWDIEGNVLASLPVSGGQHAHLTSRLDPEDWKWVSRTSRSRGTWHEVFAPVPMLVVTVQDGVNMARAFCSNVPFLDVILPADTVVSASAGNDTPVLVALPLMDVTTLSVKVDGVDILAGLGLDPATAFPGGPFGGVVDVNGSMVQVSDLVVNAAGIDTRTANTLSMTLANLGCGGHVVLVSVQRRSDGFGTPQVMQPTTACHLENGTDTGTVMVFKIDVTTPVPGDVTSGGPTHVVGEACHGLAIASANINGFDLDVLGQTVDFGNGETSADTYRLTFDVMVPEADLRAQVDSGGGTSGSFTKGSNRLIAQACDPDGNCTYDSFFFAVGPIVAAPSATTAVTAGPDPGEVQRAFVLSISQNGINNFFEHLKNRQKRCLGRRAEDAIRRTPPNRKPIPVDGACDPPTTMFVNNASLRNDSFPLKISLNDSATADPREGSIGIRINLPPIDIEAHFGGYCEAVCANIPFVGRVCAVCVTVDLDGAFNQQDMGLEFTVTRNRLLQSGLSRDQRDPLDFNFDIGTSPEGKFSRIRGEIDIGCLLGFILDVIDFFFQVLTFGLWDPGLGSPIVKELTADDIVDKFGSLDGDPMDVDLAKFKNDDLPSEFGMRQRDSRVSDAAINSTGLSVAIGASFAPEPSEIDPAAANIQGTPLKNAPIPIPPFTDAAGNTVGDVTIAISDDVFNQVFYSMVQTGRLRTQFEVSRTLGNFIPEDCSTITNDRKRARCIGLRSEDTCDRFCARFNGCDDACEVEYPYGGGVEVGNNRRQCCRAARIRRNTNIQLGTTLVLTGRVHNPPKLLIDDDPATVPVEIRLQYDQISIHLIADRDGDGNLDSESLDGLPSCSLGDLDAEFGTQSTDQTACILWETCLTARINLSMGVEINPRGRPRLKFNFEGIERDVPFGVQCGGTEFADLDFFNGEAGRSETMDLLEDRLGRSTPDLDVDGVDLGRTVLFQLDRVVAIETQPPGEDDGFQDYIGITGNIVARPDLCGNGTCDTEEDEDDCNCPEDCP